MHIDTLYTFVYNVSNIYDTYTEEGVIIMRDKFKDNSKEEHHRSERHKQRGPKTFRRGRALAFLEMLNLKRSTIKQQLEEPEFQSIQQILVGELKAIDMTINEFTLLFDIHENEVMETETKNKEQVGDHSEEGT